MEKSDKIVILKLKKITVVSLIFMTVELCGGYFAHSIAIMADAFHLLSDVFAYVISLYAVLLSYKKAPKYLAFGYEKAQPFGALINVAIIWIVTIELFF
jgi:cation diffusion facilitator family transporter